MAGSLSHWHLAAVGAVLLMAGCGDGAGDSPGASDPRQQAVAVVQPFLEAVRRGDDEAAEALLTPLARHKTRQAGMSLAPPGRDAATYEIVGTEDAGDGVVHVQVHWSDVGPDGQPKTDDIVWVVRRGDQQWGIAGMGVRPGEGRARVYLDFENPAAMQDQLQRIERETAASAATTRQAQQPAVSAPPR